MPAVMLGKVRFWSKSGWLRTTLFVIVGALFFNSSCPLADCLNDHFGPHSSPRASTRTSPAPVDDRDCCSFCLCCHFNAEIGSVDFNVELTTGAFVLAGAEPAIAPPAGGAFDHPPRA